MRKAKTIVGSTRNFRPVSYADTAKVMPIKRETKNF